MIKKTIIAIAMLTALSAYADNCGNDKSNGNASCGTGTTTGTTNNSAGAASNSASHSKSNSSSKSNSNSNAVSLNKNSNSNSTTATMQVQASGQGGSSNNDVYVGNAYSTNNRQATATAFAPTVYPTANCSTGGSVGIQGMSFGVSAGGSGTNETCETIEAAKALNALGDTAAAQEVLCNIPKIREARKNTGKPCWYDTAAAKAAIKQPEVTDPYIRMRLNLEPLK